LHRFLQKRIDFDENEVRSLVISLLSGLSYCHNTLDITLTNLNPESICVDAETGKGMHARICNFNHFHRGDTKTLTVAEQLKRMKLHQHNIGERLGFPQVAVMFMAPEQLDFIMTHWY
jgi:serine/threonine protein kinase